MFRCCARLMRGFIPVAAWLQEKTVLPNLLYRRSLSASYLPVRDLSVTWPCAEEHKDYSLPNSSWNQDMRSLYNKYMELIRVGTWIRLPSYRRTATHFKEQCPGSVKLQKNTRLFTRIVDEEGLGFEYVMFYSKTEQKMVCLFQAGPYLEGPLGFTHGGSIATMIDTTTGYCALCTIGKVMTANLSINYKTPIVLGSTVVIESKVDKIEGRKVFLTAEIRSVDGEVLHANATALFIQLNWSN